MASAQPRVVIVGAGIVGCALADEITRRGWSEVTVLEQGPLFVTGGSSSHAPGLVFQTNPAKTMTEFARYTVRKYTELTVSGQPCFDHVGGLEVAGSPERWEELKRKHGWAGSWGVETYLRSPRECAALHPLLDPAKIYGGFHIPSDGLAKPVRAAQAQAQLAQGRGARFLAHQTVTGVRHSGGRVRAVTTESDEFPADIVVCCAGIWGPRIGAMVGMPVPLVPMAHQYAKSAALPELAKAGPPPEARHPILRHQDQDLYFREHFDRIGVGAYGHRPMPVPVESFAGPQGREPGERGPGDRSPGDDGGPDEAPAMPSVLPFTADDFEPWWREAAALLPALGRSKVEEGINGLFSFTPDGMPLLGESPDVRGFWLAEAVWITHSAGVAKAVAEWLVDGQPRTAVHNCDVNRFDEVQLAPAYVHQRGCQSFVEVYDIVHPLQPMEDPRPLRVSPFHVRQRELGGYFLEAGGWERPQWYETNAALLPAHDIPARGAWAARYWSPIAGAEAQVTRERAALYDMSTLRRCEVAGPAALAFLQRMTTAQLDRPPGGVTYTLMLNPDGGIRSDITVARLSHTRFQVAVNSELDFDWLRRHLPADGSVYLRDITPGTCCIGVWGPLARDVVQPLTDADFSHEAFGYFRARRAYIGHVPVAALRVSYVGELGWELYTRADLGLRLWDTLWEAGRPHGIIAAGRAAFNSLRLEKGYRAYGVDMTTEHNPYEAGLGFAVRMDSGEFIGRAALAGLDPDSVERRLTCLILNDRETVVMGGEPVYADGTAVGYVTSADYGYTVGASIAYAWLPAPLAVPGEVAAIEYFGERVPATVAEEPLFDPATTRIRR
jgi:glycine cleavage system aminomethyltransferase T/glycine/D-amino acid oxidase-like deaminating enzyme